MNIKVSGIPERSLFKSMETVATENKLILIEGCASTFGEVVKCLHKDFKIPRNKIGKAIVLGAVSMVSNGYAEGEPIYKNREPLVYENINMFDGCFRCNINKLEKANGKEVTLPAFEVEPLKENCWKGWY